MADDETQQSSTTEETEHQPIADDEVSGKSTPEEIEAYWKNRASGADRKRAAIEAENRVLREQAQKAQGSQAPEGSPSGNTSEADATVARLQAELEAERKGRVVDTRSAKYPNAAASLGDPSVLSIMDEGKLAALEETLRPRTRQVEANNGARAGATSKPMSEWTSEELKAHLRTLPIPSADA